MKDSLPAVDDEAPPAQDGDRRMRASDLVFVLEPNLGHCLQVSLAKGPVELIVAL